MKNRYTLKRKRRFISFIVVLVIAFSCIFAVTAVYADKPEQVTEIVVKEGDTLWGIISRHYDNSDIRKHIYQVKKFNNMSSSNIYPGDVILLP